MKLDECVRIVENIDSHQNDYLPSQLDGFVIDKCIHLKRNGSYGGGITGVVGRQAGLNNDEQKKDAIHYIVNQSIPLNGESLCLKNLGVFKFESIKKQNCVVS
jgi:hypothetical protein